MTVNPDVRSDVTFEDAISRLREIVTRMDEGELELHESMALFEEGVRLLRSAEAELSRVETRVQQLLEEDGKIRMRDLEEE